MDDRYSRYGSRGNYDRSEDDDRRYGSDRDAGYRSARDYGAGEGDAYRDRPRGYAGYDRDSGQSQTRFSGDFSNDGPRARDYDRSDSFHRDRDDGRQRGARDGDDRGFLDRAGDEVRSWFGDEEAMRRRQRDAGMHDDHYRQWRSTRIAELDRDYDEYRRENAQRFENEFTSWRAERQGQRDCLSRVTEHMEVVGSDGASIGTVDKVRGDRILLTRTDPQAGGHHHSIPSRWIQSVDDKVSLRKSADEAKAAWRDEERSNALFGNEDRARDESRNRDGENGPHVLNRSFSGTY